MNLILWIMAGLLAAVFLVAGVTKLVTPREKLAKAPGGGWALDFSAGFVKALGAVEILGAVGLILPALLDIAPILVPLAAVGLALDMVSAAIVTVRRHEFTHVLVNLIYLALAVFVAWGRQRLPATVWPWRARPSSRVWATSAISKPSWSRRSPSATSTSSAAISSKPSFLTTSG